MCRSSFLVGAGGVSGAHQPLTRRSLAPSRYYSPEGETDPTALCLPCSSAPKGRPGCPGEPKRKGPFDARLGQLWAEQLLQGSKGPSGQGWRLERAPGCGCPCVLLAPLPDHREPERQVIPRHWTLTWLQGMQALVSWHLHLPCFGDGKAPLGGPSALILWEIGTLQRAVLGATWARYRPKACCKTAAPPCPFRWLGCPRVCVRKDSHISTLGCASSLGQKELGCLRTSSKAGGGGALWYVLQVPHCAVELAPPTHLLSHSRPFST